MTQGTPETTRRRGLPPEVKAAYFAYRAAFDPQQIASGPFVTAKDVARDVAAALAARAPLSVVRLGDGEGCALFHGTPGFEGLGEFILGLQMSNQFGRRDWSTAQRQAIAADVHRAVARAGIVTAARRPAVHAALCAEPPQAVRDIRGFVGATFVQHHLAALGLHSRRPVYPEAYLHLALDPMLPALARGARLVPVSCRGADFHARLADRLGARLVGEVHVPGAFESGDLDGRPLFPDALDRVRAEVEALAGPGVLILVAAGLCAKALCVDAAARGAVAVDVGSLMDVWAGKGVRIYQDEGFVAARKV